MNSESVNEMMKESDDVALKLCDVLAGRRVPVQMAALGDVCRADFVRLGHPDLAVEFMEFWIQLGFKANPGLLENSNKA